MRSHYIGVKIRCVPQRWVGLIANYGLSIILRFLEVPKPNFKAHDRSYSKKAETCPMHLRPPHIMSWRNIRKHTPAVSQVLAILLSIDL